VPALCWPCTVRCSADLALQYSIALCGLSIGPPILNSITLIVGVVLAYFLDGGINKPQLVFSGAAFAAVAVGLGAAAHVVSQRSGASPPISPSSPAGRHPCTDMHTTPQQQQGVAQQRQQVSRRPDDSAHGCAPGDKQCSHDSSSGISCPGSYCDQLDGADAVMQLGPSNSISKDCEAGHVHSAATAVVPVAASPRPAVHSTCTQHMGECGTLSCSTVSACMQGDAGSHSPKQSSKQQRSVTASHGSSLYLGLAVAIVGELLC
jgi:hypothetical protein